MRTNLEKIQFGKILNENKSLGLGSDAIRQDIRNRNYFNVTENPFNGRLTIVFNNEVLEY